MNQLHAFSSLVEEITKNFNMSIAGKCYLSIIPETTLYKAFHEVKTSTKTQNPDRLFLSKIITATKDGNNKPNWRAYYLLLEKFGITEKRPSYFNEAKPIVFQQALNKKDIPEQITKSDFVSVHDMINKMLKHKGI